MFFVQNTGAGMSITALEQNFKAVFTFVQGACYDTHVVNHAIQ
jgi:hypothetical protein